MPALSDYVTGTISLTNGSVDFTGDATGWLLAGFKEGDTIVDITGATEFMGVIATIDANGAGTLTKAWEGPTLVDAAYRMRYQPDGARVSAQARNLVELLGNGNLQALAGLSGSANQVPMFTGPGAMTLVPRTDLVSGANYDVQVPDLAARAAYDAQAQGYAVLVADIGDGRAAIYSKNSATSADWSDPAYVTGPLGAMPVLTVTSTTTLDPGEAATFDLTPNVDGDGYDIEVGIPAGEGFLFRGDYSGVATYVLGDVARNGGSSWILTVAESTDNAPPTLPTTSNAWWQLLAQKGADGAGTGDLVGPASATDNRIAQFDGATGKLLKDGGFSILDEDDMASDSAAALPTQQSVKAYVDEAVGSVVGFPDLSRRNQALMMADNAKALAGARRYLDTLALGFKSSGDADASSANGAVDTTAGAWKPSGGSLTGPTPNTTAGAQNYTILHYTLPLTNGNTVTHFVFAQSVAGTYVLKIALRNSAGNYTIVHSQSVTHPGGTASYALTTPYLVPAAGTYCLGVYTTTANPQLTTTSAGRGFINANATGGPTGGYTEDGANVYGLGATYAPFNATLITPYQTADAARTKVRAVFEIDPIDAIVLGTDWTLEFTCDAGANWAAASTYTNAGKGQAGRTVVETNQVTCTSGTSFAARAKNLNNKVVNIYKAILEAAA